MQIPVNSIIFLLSARDSFDNIVVSTPVCGTGSSGSTPDRGLLFNVNQHSTLERLFYFFFFVRWEHV